MGLTTWRGAGRGRILTRTDVMIAKNYLTIEEVQTLELIVGQYLDFAELQARRKKAMYMKGWIDKLDSFLVVNENDVLTNSGKISAELAKEIAEAEYSKYEKTRFIEQSQIEEAEIAKVIKRLETKKSGKE